MSLLDMAKSAASDISKRSGEMKVKLVVTSGKQSLHLGPFENSVVLRKNSDGLIYFDDIDGVYQVTDYQWDGPVYQTVIETTGKTIKGGSDTTKGRVKRTGRLTGALLGTVAAAATGGIAPLAGAAVGAMVGTGNKKTHSKTKFGGVDKMQSVTTEKQTEAPSMAHITLKDQESGYIVSFGFQCDSKINGELLSILNV